jgi:hypothetical protein
VLSDDSLKVVAIHVGGSNVGSPLSSTPLVEYLRGGWFNTQSIWASHSGKCIDLNRAGTQDGTNVQQWDCNQSSAQSFRVEHLGDRVYRVVNPSSGKCLDVSGASSENGANIQLWDCNGSVAQTFRLSNAGDGFVNIQNASSGRCLDVADLSKDSGANIQQWDCNGGDHQRFKITR